MSGRAPFPATEIQESRKRLKLLVAESENIFVFDVKSNDALQFELVAHIAHIEAHNIEFARNAHHESGHLHCSQLHVCVHSPNYFIGDSSVRAGKRFRGIGELFLR